MLSHALHASFADSADQRGSDRRLLRLEARVATPAGEGGIQVHNLSRSGLLLEGTAGVAAGAEIEVELPGGTRHRAEVVWADETLLGCRFAKPLTQAQLSAALLRSEPRDPGVDPARPLTQARAPVRLGKYWDDETELAPATGSKLPLANRLWIIGALGAAAWALPAAVVWIFA